jgi:CHAT domain-containing protein
LERELNNSSETSLRNSAWESELLSSKQEFERLRDLIKVNTPLYYQNFVEKKFIAIKDVKDKILNDHQALVELFAGDTAIYVLVITSRRSYLKKIDKGSFDPLSNTYRSFISNPDLLNRSFDKFKNLSNQLYRLIFKEIDLPTGRIIFSSDGKYFPFEALVTNTQPLTYFLEDHAVSYTYSARYLLNNFAVKPTLNSYIFMGFAPVQYASGLPELSGSDQSLQRMRNYFSKTTNFIRKDASKNNFLNEYYKYRIIQLYTHATDSGYTGEPMIYFSDSVLSLSDLFYEGKPSTSLVVLSACETAKGKLYNGEGVFSFSRQFAALGIPTSVSNLWQVDNQSTYKLTELFYKYLSRGLPSDVALQKAKKEFRKTAMSKEQDLPYYWAASVLIGQSNAILSEKPFQWQWVALFVAALFLLLFIWKKRSRKSSDNKTLSTQLRV